MKNNSLIILALVNTLCLAGTYFHSHYPDSDSSTTSGQSAATKVEVTDNLFKVATPYAIALHQDR